LAGLHGSLRLGATVSFLRPTQVVGFLDSALRVAAINRASPVGEIRSRLLLDFFFAPLFSATSASHP
jgi:hypothetical protein